MASQHVLLAPSPSTNGSDSSCNSCVSSPAVPAFAEPPQYPPKGHLSVLVFILVAMVTATFLISTFSALVRQCFLRRAATQTNSATHEEEEEGDDDEESENQSPIHYIWHIATPGLEESVINSITVCRYSKGEGLIEGTDCSVCLCEFNNGEIVRILPKCCHAFHLPCIDTWLRSHVNCPLCRTAVVPNVVNSVLMNPSLEFLDVAIDETQMVNSDIEVDGDESVEATLDGDDEAGDIETGKCVSSPLSNYGSRVHSDLSDNRRLDKLAMELMMTNKMQLVKRSASMSSLFDSLNDCTPTDREATSSTFCYKVGRVHKENQFS